MATERIRYVDAASAGGDGTTRNLSGTNAAYATLYAALTAEFAAIPNLVTSDILLTIRCVGTSEDTGAPVLSTDFNFTTDATRYVIIETPAADRGATPYRFSTDRYRWRRTSGTTFIAWRNRKYVMRGLQLDNGYSNTLANIISSGPNGFGTNILLEENILRFSGATNANRGISISGSTSGAFVARNNLIDATTPSTTGKGISLTNSHESSSFVVENNTCVGAKQNGIIESGTHASATKTVRNNLCYDSGVDFAGTFTGSYNASTDATAAGTGSRASQTFTFENAAGRDFRLTGADAGARTYGADLSGDFTTDITGDSARGATWDIGAHQVTVGSSDVLIQGLQDLQQQFGTQTAIRLGGLLQ